jgi:hypothetical protein
MNPTTVLQMTGRVSQLLAERLGARGRNLQERLNSRARVLPRKVRRAVQLLAQAEAQAASPKMIRQADMSEISRAYDLCLHHLMPLGAGARLRALLLSIGASVLFALLVVAVSLLALLRLRGLI